MDFLSDIKNVLWKEFVVIILKYLIIAIIGFLPPVFLYIISVLSVTEAVIIGLIITQIIFLSYQNKKIKKAFKEISQLKLLLSAYERQFEGLQNSFDRFSVGVYKEKGAQGEILALMRLLKGAIKNNNQHYIVEYLKQLKDILNKKNWATTIYADLNRILLDLERKEPGVFTEHINEVKLQYPDEML